MPWQACVVRSRTGGGNGEIIVLPVSPVLLFPPALGANAGVPRCALGSDREKCEVGNAGLYGAVRPRPAPHGSLWEPSLGSLRAPRGNAPALFPAPFCGAGAKNKRSYRFFLFARPAFSSSRMRYGCRFTRGLNARVHSAFYPLAATPARGKPRSPPARSRATRSH